MVTSQLLLHPAKLPEYDEAISYLQQVAPDQGKSCQIKREAEFDERSLKLSIIVPAYNVEKYIVNCLESVLQQQTSFEYEIIVVNDGSTDATPALLENYREYPNIQILNQNNQGLSAARNAGIACSKGEYLCFVDSDDELTPGSLECLVTKAVKEQAKLVVGSYDKRRRDGYCLYTRRLKDGKVENCSLPGFAHGRIIHYSVFRNLCFPEGYWFEDSFMAQIVHPLCLNDTYTTSYVCYKYFNNDVGITSMAKGKAKSLDSLWITIRLLKEREVFQLSYTQQSYEYFLSMVNLTYQRTKYLGPQVAQSVFVVQRALRANYYDTHRIQENTKKMKIEKALQENNFRKYILACASKKG